MAYVSLTELIQAARTGSALVSFPTDTVPALASHPDRAHLIFEAKQRSTQKPLILMGGTDNDLWPYVRGSAEEFERWKSVTQRYWPGALTLVLPASDRIPTAMNPQNPTTLGIRVPDCAIARHIMSQTGPLATTSVNRSGEPALIHPDDLNREFPEVLLLSPDALDELRGAIATDSSPSTPQSATSDTESSNAIPSTVVQWIDRQWTVVRHGGIRFKD
ncbi:MAG: L-threonylcarbamoyladenylate synthase [Leptolyngbyaceae bacterium]|nr:L-threonylcarbamoyladenylate synthase [Leptolyngbyaceae bacterium]